MADNEPVLVEAASSAQSEGATFTLQYKNRFLYSKYNPQKNILQAVQNLSLLPGTLVLAFSPALFYGFAELQEKCRASGSEILCVEADPALHAFAQKAMQDQKLAATLLDLDKNTPAGLDEFFGNAQKKFRRVIRLDLSAGASLEPDFYKNFFECAQNIVAAFWKNRLTLVRLGRLYSKNLFKNLIPAAASPAFEAFERTVQKPILVCGAGESLDELTKAAAINGRFFVLAVDAAVPALTSAGIKIDAIAATESQWAIEKAYIGLKGAAQMTKARKPKERAADKNFCQDQDCGPLFLFDLTSRANLPRRFDKNRAFYFSQFDKNNFLDRLAKNGLLPKIAPPLGSIGLTATYLALLLRKDPSVPVCVLGLDFSFSAGRTHALESAQSKALYINSNRLRPSSNFAAAFGLGSEKILGKDGRPAWSTKNLLGYAALFKQFFAKAQNLFDLGKSGLDLGLKRKTLWDMEAAASTDLSLASNPCANSNLDAVSNDSGLANDSSCVQNARDFLRGELAGLRALADLLSNGDKSEARDKSITLDEQISRALLGREYLYLHFPDGTEPSLERSFLTRVRSQIDFFAKDIETALAAAQS
ncbi:MAG: DUF115 domain-containing protein [Treponema sp.]|nr:DUF115 domain-containing protein [Treponema sp.]